MFWRFNKYVKRASPAQVPLVMNLPVRLLTIGDRNEQGDNDGDARIRCHLPYLISRPEQPSL